MPEEPGGSHVPVSRLLHGTRRLTFSPSTIHQLVIQKHLASGALSLLPLSARYWKPALSLFHVSTPGVWLCVQRPLFFSLGVDEGWGRGCGPHFSSMLDYGDWNESWFIDKTTPRAFAFQRPLVVGFCDLISGERIMLSHTLANTMF